MGRDPMTAAQLWQLALDLWWVWPIIAVVVYVADRHEHREVGKR
jgi:hypothetical protein